MQPTKALQETLYKEMLGRIKQTDLSVPDAHRRVLLLLTHRGRQTVPVPLPPEGQHDGRGGSAPRSERARRRPHVSRARRLRRQRRRQLAGVLDRHDRLPAVHAAREGPAHRRRRSSEAIERTGSVVWATDNKTLFYTTEDAVSKRSDKFWRHVVGADQERAALRGEGRAVRRRRGPLARQEDDLRRVVREDVTRAPLPRRRTTRPAAFKVVLPRQAGHEYDVDHYNGEFYITTNKGAKNFRVVTAPIADPSEAKLEAVHRPQPGGEDRRPLVLRRITSSSRSAKAG